MQQTDRKQKATVKVDSREELKKLVEQIPDGTILSLDLEVIMTGEQNHGESE